jgi:hypothetical protein
MLQQSFPDVPALPDIDHILRFVIEIINAGSERRDVFEVE